VGAISSFEDVNTAIAAGRADLCALGRPHLYDPYWTLHAAAEQGYREAPWIVQYRAGSRRPQDGRDAVRTAARRFDGDAAGAQAPARWRPAVRPKVGA
jgi:anthraniloyl-CoA monooxygenase